MIGNKIHAAKPMLYRILGRGRRKINGRKKCMNKKNPHKHYKLYKIFAGLVYQKICTSGAR
jgi:hypothetical protein